MKTLNVIFILFSTCFSAISFAQTKTEQGFYGFKLHGKVRTDYGIPIPGAEIVVESKFEYRKIKTNDKGEFEALLPLTIYRIGVNEWRGKLNYPEKDAWFDKDCASYIREGKRAGFRMVEGQSATINFVLPEAECTAVTSREQFVENYGMFGVPSHSGEIARARYETIFYPTTEFRENLDLVIQFGQRLEKENTIVYKSAIGYRYFTFILSDFEFERPFPGVIVTYDFYSIYMNEAKFDGKKKELYGKGNIVVEDGNKRYKVNEVRINLAGIKPEIKLVK